MVKVLQTKDGTCHASSWARGYDRERSLIFFSGFNALLSAIVRVARECTHPQVHNNNVFSSIVLVLYFPFVAAHEEMRKLIETMPHPTRVDSLSWKLKYFYESCTALEHIVVPEQKLIRVIDQMGNVSLSLVFLSFFYTLA